MTDMRHKYNNALTSILGNCDLILLDAHQLSSPMKAQVETIRNMTMRLNEVFQRFSSLQKEMQLLEQQKKAMARQAGA
jgi:FtsZ-binding cell division protein ZapB